ncbi:MAG TPA: LacI family DNA-binding transcriptional regulator [Kineosporiaceae bacterium]|nr:LacI family DNA-binding transcriptional regulator [Kineosporiaceae bacterium]
MAGVEVPFPGARKRPPSQADVAMLAGVSAQTVSRVANGLSNVDGQTRERVLTAMRELGYQRNSAARALVLGRFHMLGVISFDLSAHGNARTLAAISRAAQAAGYSVNVAYAEKPTEDAVQQAFFQLTGQAVDGVVVIEAQILDRQGLHLPSAIPVVVADGAQNSPFSSVDNNQAAGAGAATQHLLDLGHRTVWHVGGPEDSYSARRRAAAWRGTLTQAQAPVPPQHSGDWTAASGYRIGTELAARDDVTAIFAANDHMALGVMLALHEAGRDVPTEVSVVGYDDVPESACFIPPLTTVHQDFEEIGRQCVGLLLDQLDAGVGSAQAVVSVAPRLVVRASTGPPPAA